MDATDVIGVAQEKTEVYERKFAGLFYGNG